MNHVPNLARDRSRAFSASISRSRAGALVCSEASRRRALSETSETARLKASVLACDGELNPEQNKQVAFIRRAAESLTALVNDLLDLAKVEAGALDAAPLPALPLEDELEHAAALPARAAIPAAASILINMRISLLPRAW